MAENNRFDELWGNQQPPENNSPPSSPEPEPAEGQVRALEGGIAVLNIQQPLEVEVVQNVHQRAQPLILRRHNSTSSLDESSQKYRAACINSSLASGGDRRPVYKNASHPQRAINQLRHMRNSDQLTDVTLVAGGKEFKAHKSLLAACSPYFLAMFTSFEEKNKSTVTLQGVEASALEILINFCYSSEVEVTEENVQSLLPAANLTDISDVKDACCEFLMNQLHPSNALGIKNFADLHGCMELLNATNTYIESHFSEVLDCEEFYALDCDQVSELIRSDCINVPSEEKVYESVIAWVNHDLEERGQYLPKLMEHVRLPLLSKDYLLKRVDTEGLFKVHAACKDYIIEALKFHLATGQSLLGVTANQGAGSSLSVGPGVAAAAASSSACFESQIGNEFSTIFSSPRTRPRQPIGLPKVLVAIGGQAPKAVRSVEIYDFKDDRWLALSDMPVRRCRCGVAVVRGLIYAVGGFNGSLRVRTVDAYDPVRDAWTTAPNMEKRRSTLGVAVLNDKIYAVGGFDGSTGLNSAEVLDLSVACVPGAAAGAVGYLDHSVASIEDHARRRQWRSIANMSTRRSSVGVGVLGKLIFAVGGYDGNSRQCLASVEVYCPEQDVWRRVSDMSARRSGAGVGVLNGQLYAVGGHDGPLVRKSVECYNTDRDEWITVSDMNYCRRNAGVVTHNGLLYVIGGDDGSSNLQSVELYNPKTDVWSVLSATMSLGRSYTGVCVIDKPDGL